MGRWDGMLLLDVFLVWSVKETFSFLPLKVFEAVRAVYGRDSDVEEEHLERFDIAVRTKLPGRVLEGSLGGSISLRFD